MSNGIEKRVIELDIENASMDISHIHNGTTHRPKGLKLGIFRVSESRSQPRIPQTGNPQGSGESLLII